MTIIDTEYFLLIKAIYLQYNYDFSNYSKPSFRRRVDSFMIYNNLENVSELIPLLLHNKNKFNAFLNSISVTVTEIFRNPKGYLKVRELVIPELNNLKKRINIWDAGCSTGEEVYSLAILFYESNLLDSCEFYATDINTKSLDFAKKGIYNSDQIKLGTKNYNKSGRKKSFNNYYTAHSTDKNEIKIKEFIQENVSFFHHNLTIDKQFMLMQMIVCRNVLIYFNRKLQNQVLEFFDKSLEINGFLWLGTKETIEFSPIKEKYIQISETYKIYKKIIQ